MLHLALREGVHINILRSSTSGLLQGEAVLKLMPSAGVLFSKILSPWICNITQFSISIDAFLVNVMPFTSWDPITLGERSFDIYLISASELHEDIISVELMPTNVTTASVLASILKTFLMIEVFTSTGEAITTKHKLVDETSVYGL